MTDRPRVTLGVMTYNNERYLAGAFDAVLAQDFSDFEVVVCDNQSTDATWDICQRYAAKDSRFRIHRNESNLGFSGNFNRVASLARGEYFRLTAHDDLIAPTLLSRCVEVMDANPQASLVYPHSVVIDGAGNYACDWDDMDELRDPRPSRRLAEVIRTYVLCNELFGLMRTETLRRTKMYRPFSATDVKLLCELAVRGEFHVVPEPLFLRRIHNESSFIGDHAPGELYRWLEPELAKEGQIPSSYDKPGGDDNRLTIETIKALMGSEFSLPMRLRLTATFATVWHIRRTRRFLGRWRRKLMGVPKEPPPWEAAGQTSTP